MLYRFLRLLAGSDRFNLDVLSISILVPAVHGNDAELTTSRGSLPAWMHVREGFFSGSIYCGESQERRQHIILHA